MNVKLLLEWGADPTMVNEAGNVPAEVRRRVVGARQRRRLDRNDGIV